ncbi:hypothetical protein K8T06_18050, partial [bacterium]|nr:hypothetical protein [bacterium]
MIFCDAIEIGCPGNVVEFSVDLSNPDYDVDCFGLEFHFDDEALTYENCIYGDLDPPWLMFNCYDIQPGIIRIGGFGFYETIPSGSYGALAELTFISQCSEYYWEELIPYSFHWMMDDIQPFQSISGEMEIQCVRDSHNGDTNLDHHLSSEDSQLAFMEVLGLIQLNIQQLITADCNGNHELTSEDAQMIFQAALGMISCSDPC